MIKAVAVIPARGGSQRIPMKNIKMFHGKPIIAYSINAAIESKLFDRVIVSTDNQMIAAVAQQHGAEVIMRSEEMSLNDVGTQAVMAHVLKDIECEYACGIYPTCPMLTANDLGLTFMHWVHSGKPFGYLDGQLYWGFRKFFLDAVPLEMGEHFMQKERFIDINTHADWERSEQMFAKIHGIAA